MKLLAKAGAVLRGEAVDAYVPAGERSNTQARECSASVCILRWGSCERNCWQKRMTAVRHGADLGEDGEVTCQVCFSSFEGSEAREHMTIIEACGHAFCNE